MQKLTKNLKVWLLIGRNLFLSHIRRKVSPVFILGKIIQLALLFYLVEAALFQVLFILVALFILREVYCLRKLVLLDNFDLIRVKPLSSWLRILIICQYLGLTNYW